MTPNEKKHVKAALEWLDDAQEMILRGDLVDTRDSVSLAQARLFAALALSKIGPRRAQA